jgi:hydrogenase-4 component B
MLTLLFLLLVSYAIGVILPLCVPRMPQMQGVVGGVCGCAASIFGGALGISGLVASEPLTASIASAIPFLTCAVRLDSLSSFFVLTISLVGLAASIYALGYLKRCVISV